MMPLKAVRIIPELRKQTTFLVVSKVAGLQVFIFDYPRQDWKLK